MHGKSRARAGLAYIKVNKQPKKYCSITLRGCRVLVNNSLIQTWYGVKPCPYKVETWYTNTHYHINKF